MDITTLLMWLGFIFASYSVVGNDVIQTLGTFLASNSKRPWWVLWAFASTLLVSTLLYGWYANDGDVSYNRLSKYPLPSPFEWYYVLPPLVLLFITRFGIPVSTSFLILTFFSPKGVQGMLTKSLIGYAVAFGAALILYFFITRGVEKKFIENPIKDEARKIWVPLQWLSTGFLWSQWLIQDFANIYVYLDRDISLSTLVISMVILVAMLAFVFYSKGGAIQRIVNAKTNTTDIRSATIIDFSYGVILYYFKELNDLPMSTTWVFLGLLAGREIAVRWRLDNKLEMREVKGVLSDLFKVTIGLAISIALVFFIYTLSGEPIQWK